MDAPSSRIAPGQGHGWQTLLTIAARTSGWAVQPLTEWREQVGQHCDKTALLAAAAFIPQAVQLSACPAPLLSLVGTLQLAAATADWQLADSTAVKCTAILPWVNFADE